MGLASKLRNEAGVNAGTMQQQPGMNQPSMGMSSGMQQQPGMNQPGTYPMKPDAQQLAPGSVNMQQPGMMQQPSMQQQPSMGMQQQPSMNQPSMGMQQQPGVSQSQNQYGSSYPQQQMGSAPTGNDMNMLTNKLQTIIQQNGLQNFYPQQRLQQVLQKLQRVDFGALALRWRLPKELAYDLAPLALYDVVLYCDDSGSMEFDESGERIEDLKMILSKISEVITLFDDDGICVRFMNSPINGDGIRNEQETLRLLSQIKYGGITPIGTQLENKIIRPFSSNMQKPILCIMITDGEPSGESKDTLCQVIKRAKNNFPGAFAFQIAQVGKDLKAQQFLASLDNDPVVGHMIDCTSYYEYEALEMQKKGINLTPEMWLLKLCVGAIDRSYDTKDE